MAKKIVIHGLPNTGTRAEDPVRTEVDAALQLYEQHGFTIPKDLSATGFMTGIGKAFMPEEFAPARYMPNAGLETKQYFAKVVQPELTDTTRRGEAHSLTLARQLGRVIGAGALSKSLIRPNPPLEITPDVITVDAQTVPHKIEAGNIIELGMGINGLFSHFRNVRAETYNVLAVQHTVPEVQVLRGLADYLGLDDQQCAVTEQGIPKTVDALIANGHTGAVDAVIASRVHNAGADLQYGIRHSGTLLHEDGLLIARGPRRYPNGYSYDDVARQVQHDPQLHVTLNHTFTIPTPYGRPEANRLIRREYRKGWTL